MKKWYCVLMSLFLLANFVQAGEWVGLTGSGTSPSVQVLDNTGSRILLNYQIPGYEKEALFINGEEFNFIGLAGESRLWVKGYPELPRLCRSVVIPDNALMAATVLRSEYRDIPNIKIAPSKGHLLRTVDPASVPYEFAEVYQQDAWYPQEIVTLRDPYILRDVRGQVVEINAFQYNPARQVLRVYTNLTVQITSAGVGGENVLMRSRALTHLDPTFKAIYGRHFLNFDDDRYTPVEEIGPMLVITYDNFHDAVMPLVDWKNQKGIPTTIEDISVIGNTPEAIKSYIRDLYQTQGLTFVLLVGDYAQVTSPISGGGLDPTYGLLVGSDHYPELFVGRFSAETEQQAIVQVTKALEYEKMPQTGAAWYHQGTGIASDQGPGHYGEYDFEHIDLIRHDLLEYGYTLVDQIYDPTATQAMISNALNSGRSTVNYCGHGSDTSWGTTNFNNTNVNNLVNDNMLPFITSVACLNGNFTGGTCFGEAWLRAAHGGEPTGAVGFWGSSQSQSWDPPMYAQDEFIDLLVADEFHDYGALCFNGAMLMIDETGGIGESEFDHWIVFGDPSLQVRTAEPGALAVSHADQIDYGQPTFPVTVTGIAGALAALSYQGELLGNGYSDSTGQAIVTITGQLPPGGYVTLTVTAYNNTPYFADIPVVTGGPDIWPPLITTTPLGNTTSSGPYAVNATIVDFSGVAAASIFYSADGVNFTETPMTNTGGTAWTGSIPGQPVGTTVSYYLHAVDASPQANAGNTSTYSFQILGVIFTDDMESGVGEWTHVQVTPTWNDQWHLSNENSHSVTHAWKCGDASIGNYADHADGGLISQVISLGDNCTMTFWHWIAAEASGSYPDSAYDGGVVEISHNGGPWAVLPLSPGYTHYVRATAGSGNPYTGPFTPGTPVFSGASAGWSQQTANLSAYVGDVQLRFRFGSDNNTNNEGWYIDDVQIIGLPTGSTPDVNVSLTPFGAPIEIPAAGGSFSYNVAVANGETTPQTFDAWCNVTLPDGSTYGPVLGPVNLTLGAGASLDRTRTQNVPGSAPAGSYSYNAFAGVYPGVIWGTDSFPFTKLGVGNGPAVGGWENWGQEFNPWMTQTPAEAPIAAKVTLGLYPNPFNPLTRFSFSLPEAAFVNLKVYDLQGRLVAELVNGLRGAGNHEVTFDASSLASGIYLYRLSAGAEKFSGKLMLVK